MADIEKEPVKITAVVLAAGLSTRMGSENKLLMNMGKKHVICQTLENILASQANEVIVVLGNDAEQIRKAVATYHARITIVYNPDYAKGLTASIHCGVKASGKTASGIMMALGDMPLIMPADYNQLICFFGEKLVKNDKTIVVPYKGKSRGNPVVFSAFYRAMILANDQPECCKHMIQKYRKQVVEFQVKNDWFTTDFDTSKDFENYLNSHIV